MKNKKEIDLGIDTIEFKFQEREKAVYTPISPLNLFIRLFVGVILFSFALILFIRLIWG